MRSVDEVIRRAHRALVLGIGGGGDVVGSLAIGRLCESLGTDFVLGGVAWERFAIDPHPGPRSLGEIHGGRPLAEAAVLAEAGTTTPDGTRFAEAGMAAHLGAPTVLVDVTGGPGAAAAGIADAAEALDCDLAIYVDVGGDVLAQGGEAGLGSPLCDAVMLAAAMRAADRVSPLGAVFGPGCDGELTADEVLERVAALAARGAWIGTWGLTEPAASELEAVARAVPTEASLQAVRCARGETGEVDIRGGLRHVRLSPVGALTFFFDVRAAYDGVAPLARAVAGAVDLEQARDALAALGIRTELDYERDRARQGNRSGRARPDMVLRPLVEGDEAELRRIQATPEVSRWWDEPDEGFPLSDEPDATRLTIEVDGAVAGMIQFSEELEPKYRHAGIDLFVDPALHGRGLGTEAVRRVVRHLFEDRGHHRITIDPAAANTAAIRTYEKVGFRPVGVMRRYERDVGGEGWHDGLLMELVAGEERGLGDE
jgi:RimJ/RimL family protein N-acetyltransferase